MSGALSKSSEHELVAQLADRLKSSSSSSVRSRDAEHASIASLARTLPKYVRPCAAPRSDRSTGLAPPPTLVLCCVARA